mgnify:CR=1 FL=1
MGDFAKGADLRCPDKHFKDEFLVWDPEDRFHACICYGEDEVRETIAQFNDDVSVRVRRTTVGELARDAAGRRPRHSPIFAFSPDDSLAGSLCLLRAVHPISLPACAEDPAGSVEGALTRLRLLGRVRSGDRVVVVIPHRSSNDNEVEAVKMHVIE